MSSPPPSLDLSRVDALATALLDAFETGSPLDPISAMYPDLTVDDAYAVQRALIAGHVAAGRTVTGRKIGLTSEGIQKQLGVDSPDFGVLFDTLTFRSGEGVSMSALNAILPRIEGEVGFILSRPLAGPGVSAQDVREATAGVMPVFELIDSRIRDWKITLVDTVADNASCLGAVIGDHVTLPDAGPLPHTKMTLARDGEILQAGEGSAVLGDPAEAVAWLANELGARGDVLPAGVPILSGSLTPAVDALPGRYVADFGPLLGTVTIDIEA
ncbi:2-hydroxyhexa-2,4-dienoate hydratase [Paraconexibacter sp. AEG42_29]|uniref:2-hydroxyhexa-2,4-dienoate hydratase n=1 Tax=Paraconexibacter sp. AEG42_29 TaxID=2997339 RepID=A0AAU7AQQ5_9ACTN